MHSSTIQRNAAHSGLQAASLTQPRLSVADLALVMDMGASSQKIVQKLLSRLREGGLVSTYVTQSAHLNES
jgi:hypothetical protein